MHHIILIMQIILYYACSVYYKLKLGGDCQFNASLRIMGTSLKNGSTFRGWVV